MPLSRPLTLAITLTLTLSGCASAPPLTAAAVGSMTATPVAVVQPEAETPQYWFQAGASTAARNRADLPTSQAQAKNVIVFLGDGMSLSTIATARILEGQRQGRSGEENRLSFEEFPYTALSRTYETDAQTPDSSGTMSAIMTGVKTRYGVISVNQQAERGNCASARGNEAVTALELASAAGLATGVVTTTRVTHATPAATFGHSPDRGWEHDAVMPAAAHSEGCHDLARQLIEFDIGRGIDVVLGGGRSAFMPDTAADPEYPDKRGSRKDGRDLIAAWQQQPNAVFVWNAEQLAALDSQPNQRVLGLFEASHMHYEAERAADVGGEPSLAEMTRAAIQRLARHPQGFFLMVEGGRIDHAHHAGNAARALGETVALSDAVRAATELTSADDTLILVTSDHSHTMTMAGYPGRGNPILGKVRGPTLEAGVTREFSRDSTGLPYTTLGYANGPGYLGASDEQPEGLKHYPHQPRKSQPARQGRPDLSNVDTEALNYLQEATLPLGGETHSGEDVAVFAYGPGAAAVRGSLEQNVLFHLYVQANPAMRAQLCQLGSCDSNGVPVHLPSYQRLREQR